MTEIGRCGAEPGGGAIALRRDGARFTAWQNGRCVAAGTWRGESFDLAAGEGIGPEAAWPAWLAMIERLFSEGEAPWQVLLDLPAPYAVRLCAGYAAERMGDRVLLDSGRFFQNPALWLLNAGASSFPLRYVFTQGQRHPARPPKPQGTVYRRWIPWLEDVFSLRTLAGEADLALLHLWMNDPRVDAFWNEAGDLAQHRAYLAKLDADPHMIPLLGCIGARAFCYFEIYWAKEDRLGPYYDAQDWDRGWHVLVGEEDCRGRNWVTAWLPSLMHYLFLDDARTQRIVGEPRVDHAAQLRNLDRAGFGRIKEIVLPHKRAVLVRLEREHFFSERLWVPAVS